MFVANQARRFWIAVRHLSFLSRIRPRAVRPDQLGRSSVYFPLAGFLLGLFLVGSFYVLSLVFSKELACLAVLLLLFAVTGSDQVTACLEFFEQVSRLPDEEKQADREPASGLGVFGVSGLFFLFMFKFVGLVHIGPGWIYPVLLLMPTLSRWSLVYLSRTLSSVVGARHARLAYVQYVGLGEFLAATAFALILVAALMGLSGLFIFMFVAMWTTILERFSCAGKWEITESLTQTVVELNEIMVLLAAMLMSKTLALSSSGGIWL